MTARHNERSEVLRALIQAPHGSHIIIGVAVFRKEGGVWVSNKHHLLMDSDQLMGKIVDIAVSPWVIL